MAQAMTLGNFTSPQKAALTANKWAVPFVLVALLSMIVVPLPPIFLDVFFTFNIALSLMVILAVIYVDRPLEFNVFPSILLLSTLFRLALNVASTRVVLLEGHTGPDAAGKVIEAFGEFVIGGNYTVGIVVFIIIVIINFVVVTKGAGRISEVTARFTLDSMPGKQMAIDADLAAGMLSKEDALNRREEVRMEADFYGSMDGASKFVRGDAIAGILILLINIVGGLIIGIVEYDLEVSVAVKNYTLLTIGDGLVAQIPSLILSTAVAMIVTRMSHADDVGQQIVSQLFRDPRVLYATAGIIGLLGLIPGMPNMAFLSLSSVIFLMGWHFGKEAREAEQAMQESAINTENLNEATLADDLSQNTDDLDKEIAWEDVGANEALAIEVGYRLVPMVDDKQGGELLNRIRGVRRKLSQDLGFLFPKVHIRDNLNLPANDYRLLLNGDEVGQGQLHPSKVLALNPSGQSTQLQGIETQDPSFNMPALWIDASQKDQAQIQSLTVVDCETVLATHLSENLKRFASELFGHKEAQALLDLLKDQDEQLAEALVPTTMTLSRFVHILQALLEEGLPIRNLRVIAQTLTEFGLDNPNVEYLVSRIRERLGRMILQSIAGSHIDEPLEVASLSPELEQLLHNTLQNAMPATNRQSSGAGIEPNLAQLIQAQLQQFMDQQIVEGKPPILLVSPDIRPWLSRFLRMNLAQLHVLAYTEVPDDLALKLTCTVNSQPATDAPGNVP